MVTDRAAKRGRQQSSTLAGIMFRKDLFLVFVLAWGITGCSLSLTKDLVKLPPPSACPGLSIFSILANPDRFNPNTPRKTMECALSILRNNLKTMDRAELASRICYMLADSDTNDEQRKKLAAEGVRWGEIALNLGDWFDGPVHYYLALNLGIAIEHTTITALKNLGRLEKEMKKARKYAPDTDEGGPARILAMIYLKAPSWPKGIGDVDKAVSMLKQVVQDYPNHPLNHIFYAEALWDAEDDDAIDDIRTQLDQAVVTLNKGDWGYSKALWLGRIRKNKCDTGILKRQVCK